MQNRERVGRSAGWVLALTVALSALAAAAEKPTPLYGPSGVAPAAVMQGTLGSCYFHATIAALAVHHSDALRAAIEDQGSGVYKVSFRNAPAETVQLEDVLYARQKGFDRSDGLWVAVLLRGMGQRTVREALAASFDAAELPAAAKTMAKSILNSNDLLLLAYDRAIRSTIKQDGSLSRESLKAEVKSNASELGIPVFLTAPAFDILDAAGFFETLSKNIQARGELFGAYRSVGQGGLPTAVIEAFFAPAHSLNPKTAAQARAALSAAERTGKPVVAIALGPVSEALQLRVHQTAGKQDWYVGNHAYTVLGYDPATDRATLRNPWGHNPAPGGVFTLSMDDMVEAFPILCEPGR